MRFLAGQKGRVSYRRERFAPMNNEPVH
jgi:hypothetical protein